MSTQTIFIIAMIVFALMVTGLVLTMIEFNRKIKEPSKQKGTDVGYKPATHA